MRKLRPRFRLQNGTYFPEQLSSGNCIPESGLRTGHAFRRRPQAEAVPQNRAPEWDVLSGSAFKRKLRPGIAAQNGMHFPPEPLTETASRNSAPEWDTFSGTALKRKLRPVLRLDSGTRFPLGRHPESASHFEHSIWDMVSAGAANRKVCPGLVGRRAQAQQPLQLHVVEPCRQHGLPDTCRLQLFREHSCRADFTHGKAQQGMAVER